MTNRQPVFVLAFIVLFAGLGAAQGTGPDLAVTSMPTVSYWGSEGGLSAFSLAGGVENIGDVTVPVVANTPAHPIILMNLYRHADGRIQQLGQSWVKHMFAAGGTGCNHPQSWLNPGCIDVYSSNLNGSQTLLGPKAEVNATTGIFPYPFSTPTITSPTLDRRLQVRDTDIDPALNPGARYFGEVHYIDPTDAAAGLGNNNASWREVTITGGTGAFSATFTGPIMTEQAAIQAWQTIDTDVQIESIDVAGDGRYEIGFRVQPLGGGQYRWEFAAYNMNSHLAARSFSVALPTGAVINSSHFMDVDYHSGEGEPGSGATYEGTDWSFSAAGGTATWATADFATDANANALRWGTLYCYGFVCDQPPTGPVAVTLEPYRAGGPASFGAIFVAPGLSFAHAGAGQQTATGDAFDSPLVVEMVTPGGGPAVGESVAFSVVSGDAQITSNPLALTDASGRAQATVMAGSGLGPVVVEAATDYGNVSFDLSVYGLRVFWLPSAGTAVVNFVYDKPGMPFVLGVDLPLPPPGFIPYAYGNLHTTAASPGPNFLALDGLGVFGPPNPTVVISPVGQWTLVQSGLAALAGSGLQLVFEAYAVDFSQTNSVVISNPVFVTF